MILSTQSFSYDSMGNPTGYHDKTLTWEGKQLTGSAASTSGQTLSYAYDQNGLRTQKTVTPTTNATATTTTTNGTATITATNGIAVTTNYYYNGSVLMGMVTGSGTTAIHQLFSYDASGNMVSVDYSSNGGTSFTTYYYLRNAQNDVVKLIDGSGTTVVSYVYDSWGKVVSTTGTLASTVGQNQPFRYRGYVIVGRMCSCDNSDTETGWYYLQSRYYDPTTCRFISADVLLSTGQGVLGHNAFAYCLNNPINAFDDDGNWSMPNWLKVNWCCCDCWFSGSNGCNGGCCWCIAGTALTGAVTGGLFGAVSSAVAGGISGGWQRALDGACDGFMSGTLIGGASGALSAGVNIATGTVNIVGSAQKTGTLLHRAASNLQAGKMVMQVGRYSKIGLDTSLKKMGLVGGKRPNVIGIARLGTNKLVEVVSKSQTTQQMITKCIGMISANPGTRYGVVSWAAYLSNLL